MSRPEMIIDWDVVDHYLAAGCLGTEVAAYLAIHPNTFYRRVEEKYGVSFSEFLQIKRSKGDGLLRAKQYEKALGIADKGDNSLLIWLGKNRLSQSESPVEVSIATETINKFDVLMNQLTGLQSARKIDDSSKRAEHKS